MYSAHYDHLGIVTSQTRATISTTERMDNATGCGIFWRTRPRLRPSRDSLRRSARSILFAAVTAEEQGLRRFGVFR